MPPEESLPRHLASHFFGNQLNRGITLKPKLTAARNAEKCLICEAPRLCSSEKWSVLPDVIPGMRGRAEAAVQRKNAWGAPDPRSNGGVADSLDEARTAFGAGGGCG